MSIQARLFFRSIGELFPIMNISRMLSASLSKPYLIVRRDKFAGQALYYYGYASHFSGAISVDRIDTMDSLD